MGKRSDFERRERDFYPTPRRAVPPLIPYLRGLRSFAEPCCGEGDLIRHLQSFNLRCVYSGDIATGHDALARDSYGGVPVITNPPYHRKLMHTLILHFMHAAPFVWLLIDYDWSATKQAAPFLQHCTDIVMLPRLTWIAGTDDTGKDNHAWYRFDIKHTAGPVLHPREVVPLSSSASLCAQCGKPYRPQRSDALSCSNACRQRAYRARPKRNVAVTREGVGDA